MTPAVLSFLDLQLHEDAVPVRSAVDRVLASGWYVLGPEVEAFEAEFAAACGARCAVGVATGTDAIALLLRGLGVGAGQEVIVPGMTAAYTGLAVMMAGARPVFADVEAETLTLDPRACEAMITARTAAIVAVHLYGQPAALAALRDLADRHGLALIEDCCQAVGAISNGVPVGTGGAGGAFSFYPTKNLGALGDGGAITTGDPALAARLRRLRNGGQRDRYHHEEAGVNSRLDELQAAILRARLPYLPAWTERRRVLAGRYRTALGGAAPVPVVARDAGHVYHLFPVRTDRRDALHLHLRAAGIETLIHYPVPLPEQPAFAPVKPAACPEAARAARELLSLPLHPHLSDADCQRVVDAVLEFH